MSLKTKSPTTDINGIATVRKFEAGIRNVTISGPSIMTQTFENILFENTKTVTRTFTCQPSFSIIPAPQENKEKSNA